MDTSNRKLHSLTMAEVLVTMTYVVVFCMGIYQHDHRYQYDKLDYVHRTMSRVVFILLWAHEGGEIVRNTPDVRRALSMQLIAKMTQIPTISRRAVAEMRHYCHCRIDHLCASLSHADLE
ncbi:hypothetical protein M405DRAFT_879508 [Rhizopogon salebrosus TDB-379]|nr:hypothetical protein M405DRAFT_879508 [Rhizopogon salebrosus TDB-379]